MPAWWRAYLLPLVSLRVAKGLRLYPASEGPTLTRHMGVSLELSTTNRSFVRVLVSEGPLDLRSTIV